MSICDFDLCSVLLLLSKYKFGRIALQFPDEHLAASVSVYVTLQSCMKNNEEIFITADSTWGASVDDISAMHYDADVLIYFGSDLSSSGSIPVMVVPFRKCLNIEHCVDSINKSVCFSDVSKLIVLYDLCYAHQVNEFSLFYNCSVSVAVLPECADLLNWMPFQVTQDIHKDNSNDVLVTLIGGLKVSSADLANESATLIYLGDKHEQLTNIMLKASGRAVVCYSPGTQQCTEVRGDQSREFRERYGGVLRVQAAKVVGIIVGSMGLTGDATRDVLHRLQTLIAAAGKKSYCFVMGRLNESKLCNFPEVRAVRFYFLLFFRQRICSHSSGGHLLLGLQQ